MNKKALVATILALLPSLVVSSAFAGSVSGGTSTPYTQADSQGDMASGSGAYAAGSNVIDGQIAGCSMVNGQKLCDRVGIPYGAKAGDPAYVSSYAAGTNAYAGPGTQNGQSTVYGDNTAVGNGATAEGFGATAVGNQAFATGNTSTAIGSNSKATGMGSIAIGVGAKSSGYLATATGDGSTASNVASTANGAYAKASGQYSTASGAEAVASGNQSTADGALSTASGAYSTSTGSYASASGQGSTADGYGAYAAGTNGTAIGTGSAAIGNNSVALGAGSVANRANSVSVGNASTGETRQITNVSAGTQGTDAVNVNQLNGTATALQAQFGSEVAGVRSYAQNYANEVGALSAASSDAVFSAAGLRTPNRLALGVGELNGQSAGAIAYQHAFGHQWTGNITVAYDNAGTEVGAGVGFGW
jgi:autotransporter adhesin